MKMDIRPIWITLVMQETWRIKLSGPIEPENTRELLLQVFENKTKDLGIFLSYYYKKQGAVTENVTLLKPPVFRNQFSGQVSVKFDLIFFNACLNIHEKERDQLELSFEILPENAEILITGPYWPEREMDEI
ncbi:hypothetical protein BC751_3199 [Cecembia calidifontis]|uniref:Uncharacterized protein n=2 Tax=Cecembia calidifontis TaxID=1187080 RepID=A0A4Q7PBF1_9BACT|nr:hypothetical protein BC751_3199 [Cecembia calidifontis]